MVIGVHSAKFDNEGETENIRQVVMRYGIDHPVVNDKDFEVWSTWGAQAWPTIALIDPAGKVVGMQAGEGVYATVQPVIEGLIAEFGDQIDQTPFEFTPEAATRANTILSYPGKVAADEAGEFFREGWESCGRQGILGLLLPREYGGSGLGALSSARAMEALGYGCRDTGLVFSVAAHIYACIVPVLHLGSEDLKVLSGAAGLGRAPCHALSERARRGIRRLRHEDTSRAIGG